MQRLLFPQEVYHGADALENIFNRDYGSVLLLSDAAVPLTVRVLQTLKRAFDGMLTETKLITAPDAQELFAQTYRYANVEMPECLLAVGGGSVQDCAAAVSSVTGVPYVSVPTGAPTQLTELDTRDPFLYKKPPAVSILDPSFLIASDSQQLAYASLGMLALALEAAMCAPDCLTQSLAEHAFCEIFQTLMPSYRGSIAARERLGVAMTCAQTAYLNSFRSAWESPAYRIASFFSDWGSAKLTTLAVCVTHLTRYYYETAPQRFASLAERLRLTAQKELAAAALLQHVRRMQATLAFPAGMKTIVTQEQEFLGSSEKLPQEDRELCCRCYYGVIEIKKDGRNVFA